MYNLIVRVPVIFGGFDWQYNMYDLIERVPVIFGGLESDISVHRCGDKDARIISGFCLGLCGTKHQGSEPSIVRGTQFSTNHCYNQGLLLYE